MWLYAPLRSPLAISANADAVLSLDVEGRAKVTVVESVEDAGDGSAAATRGWRNAHRRRGARSSVSHHHLTQCGSMYAYLLVFTESCCAEIWTPPSSRNGRTWGRTFSVRVAGGVNEASPSPIQHVSSHSQFAGLGTFWERPGQPGEVFRTLDLLKQDRRPPWPVPSFLRTPALRIRDCNLKFESNIIITQD